MTRLPLRVLLREDANENMSSIEIAAREYATQLLADLAIPAWADLSIEIVPRDALSDEGSFAIVSGDYEPIRNDDTDRAIAARLPLAIYRNRRLFITDDTVAACAAAWLPEQKSAEDLAKLRVLMNDCVDRNISLSRIAAVLPKDAATPWSAWELLCRVHTDEKVAVVVARVAADPSISWVAMQRSFFMATGLLCPIPISTTRPDLAADEYQVRINDVHLPVQVGPAGPDASAALLAFVEEMLLDTRLALLTCDAVRQRVQLVAQKAPVLADTVVQRFGIENLCARVAFFVNWRTPVRNFDALLDQLTNEIARYAREGTGLPSV